MSFHDVLMSGSTAYNIKQGRAGKQHKSEAGTRKNGVMLMEETAVGASPPGSHYAAGGGTVHGQSGTCSGPL